MTRGPWHLLVPVVQCPPRVWVAAQAVAEAWGSGVGTGPRVPWAAQGKGLLVHSEPRLMLSPACLPVSLGFFDDILIPPESLQQPAKLYPPKVRVGHGGARASPKEGPHSSRWPWVL